MKNRIKIIDPQSKAFHDPLFCIPDTKLGEYLDANLEDICERRFQTHPDFVFRKIADEGILVPTGKVAQYFNGMINLNTTSVYLWQLFTNPSTINLATAQAEEAYEEAGSLRKDVLDFVINFYRMGLLIPSE